MTVAAGDIFRLVGVEALMETASMRAVEGMQVLVVNGGALTNPGRKEFPAGFGFRRAPANIVAARLAATRFQFVDVFSAE